MSDYYKKQRVVDKILTAVVMGYDMEQEFSGHHLFPDVAVNEMGGKIITFGKEAFVVRNTKRAPGETVRSVRTVYSDTDYVLQNRLLEAAVPEEEIEASEKANIAILSQSVTDVFRSMRLEGEYDKAQLADSASAYAAGHTETLTGSDKWSDPSADVKQQVDDAKATIRAKTGREPNVLHIDYHGKRALGRNANIIAFFEHTGKTTITDTMLAEYFDIEKVVVAKAVWTPDTAADTEFQDVWARNARLAYVPPKALQNKRSPSFGYTYVHKGFPIVEKKYYVRSNRSYNNPVLFRDKAIVTGSNAGFLLQGTTTE